MTEMITAVYERGVIHPLKPVCLPEHQRIKVQIFPETTSDKSEQIVQFLVKIGLLTPPQGYSQIKPVSKEELNRVGEILAQAASKPLSEMIIEDR